MRRCDLPKRMGEQEPSVRGEYEGAELSDRRLNARLQTIAEILIDAGHSVIVDATFLEEKHRRFYLEFARSRDLPFFILLPGIIFKIGAVVRAGNRSRIGKRKFVNAGYFEQPVFKGLHFFTILFREA